MADKALSRHIAQKGKFAVTHNALTVADMVCEHVNHSFKRGIGFGRRCKQRQNKQDTQKPTVDQRNAR